MPSSVSGCLAIVMSGAQESPLVALTLLARLVACHVRMDLILKTQVYFTLIITDRYAGHDRITRYL